MTRVLLTGGAGFIGSHVYAALVAGGFSPIIVDNFFNSKPDVIDRLARLTGAKVVHEIADICDKTALMDIFKRHKPACVIHFAALKSVGESVANPLIYFQNNIGGLINLLDVMENHTCRRLVFSSSATVYGMQEIQPIPETATRSFTNPYGFCKLQAEDILTQLTTANPAWQFGILRYFNPAGAHSSKLIGEEPSGIPNNLFPYLAKVALGELAHLSVFGGDYDTHDGTGVRDYIHVCDLAAAHVKSLQSLIKTGCGHTVNIGTGRGYSVLDIVRAYSNVVGRELPIQMDARRAGDVATCVASAERAKSVLGFQTTHDLSDMCQSSWDWVQASY